MTQETKSRKLQDQTLTKSGHDVHVETTHSVQANQHVFHVRCSLGDVFHESRMTVGAVDGTRPANYTAKDLQADLDLHRALAAEECAWLHNVNQSVSDVQ